MLTYVYHLVAFMPLARSVTIDVMTFADVTLPDMKLAKNYEFFQRYVVNDSIAAGVTAGHGRSG